MGPGGRRPLGVLVLAGLLAACGSGQDDAAETPGATALQPSPPGPDIWLSDVTWDRDGMPTVDAPTNLTQRAGYDNQPHFVPDGSGLWYTAVDEDVGQADIWRYDFVPGMVARVTASSPESEYSATPLPDGSGISVIRVEADSLQRLWRFAGDGTGGEVILPDLAPVGYHAWADDHTLIMFVLGDPPTLRRGDTTTGTIEILAEDIGRSIQKIPGSADVSFVQRHDGTSTIMRLPAGGTEPEAILETVEAGDFHAWAPNGTLLMAGGSVLYAWSAGVTNGWRAVADFSDRGLTISRLAVSPDGTQIALVGEVGL